MMANTVSSKPQRKVAYIADQKLIECCDSIPIVQGRATLTHGLIEAYGLLDKMLILQSSTASERLLQKYHEEKYIEYLKKAKPDTEDSCQDKYGLGYDCPIINDLWTVVGQLTGGTLTAAACLISGLSNIAINWCGGWHHAQRDSASGFCYVNDIVLAIMFLQTKFCKVLYIDLDIHHGDGVEKAFYFNNKVVTMSLHLMEPGYFPGTGHENDIGSGDGRYYNINIPYKGGINDTQFLQLLESTLSRICDVYAPNAVVCQCGVDAVTGDPLGEGNLTQEAFTSAVRHVLSLSKPTLFLGGGGYNKVNAAKVWTAITATILDISLPSDVPEHQYFPLYGPSFDIEITPSLRKSKNTQETLNITIQQVQENITKMAEDIIETINHRH
ncbi:Histone deacetylase 8 [Halocaridina rubra]|uniref:Histone deacetylase n=1 Tax=Halocaridina rubra TaxID=373956 RepID=A0AAN8WTE3_HALRR